MRRVSVVVLVALLCGLVGPAALVAPDASASCTLPPSGHWSGTYAGGASGTWDEFITFTPTAAGATISGTLTTSAGLSGPITSGTYDCTTGTVGNAFGIDFVGSYALDGSSVSGTWSYPAGNASGTFTGAFIPPAISVMPDTNLIDGQAVTVDGSGFSANQTFDVYECAANPTSLNDCDPSTLVSSASTDGSGAVSVPGYVLGRNITTTNEGTIDCVVASCTVLGETSSSDVATAALSFATPRAISVTPDTNLLDGQAVTVDGSGFAANQPFEAIECAATATSINDCDLSTVVSSASTDGSGAVTVPGYVLRRTITTPNEGTLVCAAASCILVGGTSLTDIAGAALSFATPPGAPTVVIATAQDASASVRFMPPSADGGSPITSYTVSATDSTTPSNGGQVMTGAASPITVAGLTNGDSYTFTVTATNSVDSGPASAASNAVVPASPPPPPPSGSPPGAPTIGAVTAGDGAVSVGFTPGGEGSSNTLGYLASCQADNGVSGSSAGAGSPIVVPGLTNGATYTCSVFSWNAVGNSPPSNDSAPVTPTPTSQKMDTCTDQTLCQATVPQPPSNLAPGQAAAVTGTPSDTTGSVVLSTTLGTLGCQSINGTTPGPITDLSDQGFSPQTRLTITLTLKIASSTTAEQVCYNSSSPFFSQTNPTVKKAGTAYLLLCAQDNNVAPCVISSKQVGDNIVTKFVVPGGDPKFCVLLPRGRLQWLAGAAAAKGRQTAVIAGTDSSSPPQSAKLSVPITVT